MGNIYEFIGEHYQWMFGGAGLFVLSGIFAFFRKWMVDAVKFFFEKIDSNYIILDRYVEIKLPASDETKAEIIYVTNYRALEDGVDRVSFGKWSTGTDGKIEITGGHIGNERTIAGQKFRDVILDSIQNRGNEFSVRASYETQDTFQGAKEFWTEKVLVRTQKIIIKINFPNTRIYNKIRLLKGNEQSKKTLKVKPRIRAGNTSRSASYEIKNPKIDLLYWVEWEW